LWNVFGADGATSKEWQAAVPGMVPRTFYAAVKALKHGWITENGNKSIPRRQP
jgi:hypothetical protein